MQRHVFTVAATVRQRHLKIKSGGQAPARYKGVAKLKLRSRFLSTPFFVLDFFYFLRYNTVVSHRRIVHRSVGDSKHLLAGRLSDKMSSELGITLFCVVPSIFVFKEK